MTDVLKNVEEELAQGTAQIFDVREEDEWSRGHLTQATFVPLSEIASGKIPTDLDKEKRTYLHCRSGKRVHRAAPLLREMGFTEIIPLSEGFNQIADFGFPTE